MLTHFTLNRMISDGNWIQALQNGIFALKRQHFQNQSVTVPPSERLPVFPSTNHDSQSSLMAFVLYKAGRNTRSPMSLSTICSQEGDGRKSAANWWCGSAGQRVGEHVRQPSVRSCVVPLLDLALDSLIIVRKWRVAFAGTQQYAAWWVVQADAGKHTL